jgi:hypothetical protein
MGGKNSLTREIDHTVHCSTAATSSFLAIPGAQLAARHEASGVLCTTTLPSLPAIFIPGMPSSFRTRRDFVREKLILSSVGTWR